jgi:2-polyprenyl-3-methyl-5-hydroxy-6-metoxy-1,4-benzoquinol methylase
METCYKIVRADILKRLRLQAETFTLEPELTCRLAQWRARVYEVPVSYAGRTYDEGKKIGPIDGIKALWQMFYSKFVDPQFTDHLGLYLQTTMSTALPYHRWLLQQVKGFVGQRVLDAGAGIGTLSGLLMNREHLVVADCDPIYLTALRQRFLLRGNVRVDNVDLTDKEGFARWQHDEFDTVFAVNVLEHLDADESVLQEFRQMLSPGGHCIAVVPNGPSLFGNRDRVLGRKRRYSKEELQEKMAAAGFEVVFAKEFCRIGAVGWSLSNMLSRSGRIGARHLAWFTRLWPLTRLLDHLVPMSGLQLLMVGRKAK